MAVDTAFAAYAPDHLLSLDEWCALPEDQDRRRLELAEGVLQVSPSPLLGHQKLILDLATQLLAAGDGRWQVAPEWELVVEAGPAATVRIPDIVLVRPDLPNSTPRIEGRDALAVVEITSPGSRRVDRVLKLHEYAEAGVPTYLLVEPGPPVTLTEFVLVDAVYERGGEHTGRAALDFGVVLELPT